MEQHQIESVGKVFEVVGGKRRCLVCEGMFTPTQAANHATTICYPTSPNAEQDEIPLIALHSDRRCLLN
jgi:hypothetical protein